MSLRANRRDALALAAAGLILPMEGAAGTTQVRARLAATENPFGPSPAARRAIIASIADAAYYPHSEAMLIAPICEHEGLAPEQVALSSGSLDALCHLATSIGRGGAIVAAQPTYSTHLAYAERHGVAIDWVPLTGDHRIDLDALLGAIRDSVRLAYVCNPNNPTGLLADPDSLRAFCVAAATRVPVIVDEAYYELAPDPRRHSMAPLVRGGHDVIVVRTFSKVYGLAGMRIGYALGRPERMRALRGLLTTSRNQAGLAAATASFSDEAYLAGAVRYLSKRREQIYRICDVNGLDYIRSQGSFVYIDCRRPANLLRDRLAEFGIEVRLFDGSAYANWMRVGTATSAELDFFASVLPRALNVSA